MGKHKTCPYPSDQLTRSGSHPNQSHLAVGSRRKPRGHITHGGAYDLLTLYRIALLTPKSNYKSITATARKIAPVLGLRRARAV